MIGLPTPSSKQVVIAGLQDADPQVRTAAVEAVGRWDEPNESVLSSLLALLEDANDLVKVEVTKVMPKLAGATPAVIDGLCRRLLEDDSDLVKVNAALALSKLGPAAASAQDHLVRAAQTGEVGVREQAMRALVMIQPSESTQAFATGLKDANGTIRMVASAGLMKVKEIPSEIVPSLVDALRDPEVQVQANAAHVLGRLNSLPSEAIPLLIECTSDPSDGLRINAAMALKAAPRNALGEVLQHLIEDPNVRVRLIAASVLAIEKPEDEKVASVLAEASGAPSVRLRQAVIELIDSLGPSGRVYLDLLKERVRVESEPVLGQSLAVLIERLKDNSSRELQRVILWVNSILVMWEGAKISVLEGTSRFLNKNARKREYSVC
jgi:HEAT repeat protein